MNEQNQQKKGALNALAKGADHIVGTVFLGGIGQVYRYSETVPVIGHATKYIRENVADGFRVADQRILRKEMANAIVEITKKGKTMPPPEMLRQMAVKFGLDEKSLEMAKQAALKSLGAKDDQEPFPAPAVAG